MRIKGVALLLCQIGLLDMPKPAAIRKGSGSNSKGTGIKRSGSNGSGIKTPVSQFSESAALRLDSIGFPATGERD